MKQQKARIMDKVRRGNVTKACWDNRHRDKAKTQALGRASSGNVPQGTISRGGAHLVTEERLRLALLKRRAAGGSPYGH